MSTPVERRDFAISVIRDTKESTVAERPRDDPGDICPIVFFERDNRFVAAGSASQVNRDEGLMLARAGITGFAADAVIFSADAHVTNQRLNPATGEPWGENEMQQACDVDGACQVGLLQDCILVVRHDRVLGVTDYRSIPYEVDKEARTVDWVDGPEWANPDWVDTSKVDGYISDVLAGAFQRPILRHDLIAQGLLPLGLPDVQQAQLDEVTMAGMRLMGMTVALIRGDLSDTAAQDETDRDEENLVPDKLVSF